MCYRFEEKLYSGVEKSCGNATSYVVVGLASTLSIVFHVLETYGRSVKTDSELRIITDILGRIFHNTLDS